MHRQRLSTTGSRSRLGGSAESERQGPGLDSPRSPFLANFRVADHPRTWSGSLVRRPFHNTNSKGFPERERQSRCATSQIPSASQHFRRDDGFVGFREYPAAIGKTRSSSILCFGVASPEVTQSRLEAIETNFGHRWLGRALPTYALTRICRL